jgi:RimJ/RimL family protein N-acetyltransferase
VLDGRLRSYSGPEDADSQPTSIQGRNVVLRPVTERDFPLFYSWRIDSTTLPSWGTNSRRIPTFHDYLPELERFLAEGITLLVIDAGSGRAAGFARAYNVNLAEGWAWIQAFASATARLRPFQVAEAAAHFSSYLFRMFPLRQLYAEVPAHNTRVLRLNRRLGFREHGRLPEHVWLNDRYWDLVFFCLKREAWEGHERLIRTLIGAEALLDGESPQPLPEGIGL